MLKFIFVLLVFGLIRNMCESALDSDLLGQQRRRKINKKEKENEEVGRKKGREKEREKKAPFTFWVYPSNIYERL